MDRPGKVPISGRARVLGVATAAITAVACLGPIALGVSQDEQLAFVEPVRPSWTSLTPPAAPAWTDSRCGGCHATATGLSHPVGVQPSMPVPADLPLEQGQITCVTCHDDSSAEAHARARLQHNSLLRTNADLCSQCHDQSIMTRQSMHGSALGQAHLAWPGQPRHTDTHDSDRTNTCLSCHDGSLASDPGVRVGAGARSDTDHPIGIVYSPRSMAKVRTLVPAAMLDSRIRLFDGKVGCGSCHSPYSSREKLLIMSNRDSALCLSCHDL